MLEEISFSALSLNNMVNMLVFSWHPDPRFLTNIRARSSGPYQWWQNNTYVMISQHLPDNVIMKLSFASPLNAHGQDGYLKARSCFCWFRRAKWLCGFVLSKQVGRVGLWSLFQNPSSTLIVPWGLEVGRLAGWLAGKRCYQSSAEASLNCISFLISMK